MDEVEKYESGIRAYSRSFPVEFIKSQNEVLFDSNGNQYIDFFSGAGALNYGHNNPLFIKTVIDHLENLKPIHSLDMVTDTRTNFLKKFNQLILEPRGLDYKIQFTGPTGTNAIEAALKLAMINKDRSSVIAFTNAYHGLTMAALSVTGNDFYRSRLRMPMLDRQFMPYDGYYGDEVNTAAMLRKMLSDKSSGVSVPAAIILETIQAEGGINVASTKWLREIRAICDEFDILLIVDDIQVGNGRTGHYFSFEEANIKPDIVALSKSIGAGLPLSLLLIDPALDVWKAGEHTGTFRSNNLALAVATAHLEYWESSQFSTEIFHKEAIIKDQLVQLADVYPQLKWRGRGLIYGVELPEIGNLNKVAKECFKSGLVIEIAGAEDNVLKILPPLTIQDEYLIKGFSVINGVLEKHYFEPSYN